MPDQKLQKSHPQRVFFKKIAKPIIFQSFWNLLELLTLTKLLSNPNPHIMTVNVQPLQIMLKRQYVTRHAKTHIYPKNVDTPTFSPPFSAHKSL